MKAEEKDQLKSLFQKMKLDTPSMSFESRLMQQIHIEARKKSKQKNKLSVLAIIGGIAGMFSIPVLILYFIGFPFEENLQTFNIEIPQIQFDPLIVALACVVLFLLVSDTLIRKHIRNKDHEKNDIY